MAQRCRKLTSSALYHTKYAICLVGCMPIVSHCITQGQNAISAHCLLKAIMHCKLSHVFGAALALPHVNLEPNCAAEITAVESRAEV